MAVKKIAVIGAGLMGSGIAYVSAVAGFDVVINDIKEEFLNRGLDRIRSDILTGIDKKKITPKEAEEIFRRISTTVDIREAAKDADLVIEAVFENLEVKQDVFKKLDQYAPPHTILASNTSTLPIKDLAKVTNRPDKVLGMHFFSPVPAMNLIEIIVTDQTSEETLEIAKQVGKQLKKEIVICKDAPGFIVNRLLIPTLNEIIKLYESKLAPMEHLDKIFVTKGGMPMGPFSLADFVGLDVALHATNTLWKAFGDDYKPPQILQDMVNKGFKGTKSGKGFKDLPKEDFEPKKSDDYLVNRVLFLMINEAAKLLDEKIATIEDIDKAMRLGTNFPKGPFELADEIGLDKIVDFLNELSQELGDFYKPHPLLVEMKNNNKKFYN